MREILFRGKTKDGEWVIGNGIIQGQDLINYERWVDISDDKKRYEVIPETVGQFTGLTDLNGKKIFEGDIIADYFGKIYGVVEYGESSFDSGILKYTGYFCKPLSVFDDGNLYDESNEDYWDRHQVIGNIHDNPELLGE